VARYSVVVGAAEVVVVVVVVGQLNAVSDFGCDHDGRKKSGEAVVA